MIIDDIKNIGRYGGQNDGFRKAADFLSRTDGAALEDGCHEIDGGRVFALVSSKPGLGRDKARLEAHRQYIDVQFCASGHDEIGIRPLSACTMAKKKYDAKKDVMFFADSPLEWVTVEGSTCVILFPQDAHAPSGSHGPMKKIVIKLKVTDAFTGNKA